MTLSQAHLAAQDKKLKGRLVVRQQLMTEEEAQLNPQVNQSRRKAAKQARKEAAKHDKKALVMATLAHGMCMAFGRNASGVLSPTGIAVIGGTRACSCTMLCLCRTGAGGLDAYSFATDYVGAME
jgi:hypothetical protein